MALLLRALVFTPIIFRFGEAVVPGLPFFWREFVHDIAIGIEDVWVFTK